jgi:hypothetical protein
MVTATSLKEQLAQKVREVTELASGLSEEQATKAPAEGEWSAKQVLSHLCGDDDALSMYEFGRFLEEETPDLGISPGRFGDVRKESSVAELVTKIETDYGAIGTFLAGLSDEQLERKAHVPFLKETPLGEYPTLGQWAGAVINYHLPDHINQLRTATQ